jgi:hypothetical protein
MGSSPCDKTLLEVFKNFSFKPDYLGQKRIIFFPPGILRVGKIIKKRYIPKKFSWFIPSGIDKNVFHLMAIQQRPSQFLS